MGRLDGIDTAGRQIAGLLTYNPGPGIYSRLERAVQQMPENVRVQELPGLLKRYKEGVPGWELKATDLDSTIAGRDVVPRDELLAAVRERSPVHTTREIRLEAPQPRHMPDEIRIPAMEALRRNDYLGFDHAGQAAASIRVFPDWRSRWEVSDEDAAPLEAYRQWSHQDPYAGREIGGLGASEAHGPTRFHEYAEPGAKDYTELVFLQPGFGRRPGHHWHRDYPKSWGANQDVQEAAGQDAVAHMRMASYGDALRLLESQSDVLNDAIKAGEAAAPPPSYHMQQAQVEMDIKRLALEAARSGKRAIEIASPESIARRVGMPLEHAQHRYGKVAASELERLGRKMGGLVDDTPLPRSALDDDQRQYASLVGREEDSWRDMVDRAIDARIPAGRSGSASHQLGPTLRSIERGLSANDAGYMADYAQRMFRNVAKSHMDEGADWLSAADRALVDAWPMIERTVEANRAYTAAKGRIQGAASPPTSKRYLMSDEMRRRLIESGVGAAVLAPLLTQPEE